MIKKIRVLLFVIIGIVFSVGLFKAGYRKGQTEGMRKCYIQNAAWLAITIDTLECIRTGDIAEAEMRLRLAGYLEAMEYLESKFCVHDSTDSLYFILTKQLWEIEKMIPVSEKSVVQQKFEFLMKWIMLEKEEQP